MSDFAIPSPADAILGQVAPALLQVLGHGEILVGGGTALAARWRHRRSTDIDMTVSSKVFDRAFGRVPALLAAASVTNIRHGRGWLTGTCTEGEFSISNTAPLLTSPQGPADRERRFGIALEQTAETLARKLRLRMFGNGEFVARDLYDICTAHEQDPSALDTALSVLTQNMADEIAHEIASLGRHAIHMGRPLADVHRPDWLDGLAEKTQGLIVSRFVTGNESTDDDGSGGSTGDGRH